VTRSVSCGLVARMERSALCVLLDVHTGVLGRLVRCSILDRLIIVKVQLVL